MTGIVLLLSCFLFWSHKHRARIWPLLVSVVGSSISVLILKYIFNTSRPIGAFYIESTPSFPSGHAAIAISLYGFLLYNAYKHDKHRLKNPLIIFLFVLIILIGLSRLYLDVHYVQDILVGYAIGLFWLFISQKFVPTAKF